MQKLDLQKTASYKEMGLMALIFFSLAFLFYSYVYQPRAKELDLLKTKGKEVASEIDSLEKQIEVLTAQKKMRTETMPSESGNMKVQIMDGTLKTEIREIPRLLGTIADPRFHEGISIASMSSKPASQQSGYSATSIQINASGPFSALASFIDQINQLPALLAIDTVTIKSSSENSSFTNMELVATLYQLEEDIDVSLPQK